MKAIVYRTYGTPEVLKLEELEKPNPKDHEVLIKVNAASINSWDWDLLRGIPYIVRLGGFMKPKFNILGADIAGRVVEVGKNVKQFTPGDEVFGDISGCSWGGFAEYVCVNEQALSLKPERISYEHAAAVPQAAVLALQGLRDKGQIRKGDHLLINGAGGGVGTFAVQFAKLLGAEVTAVDSGIKLDMLRGIGADHVIDYKKTDFTTDGHRYDLILDMIGNRSIFVHKRLLNPNGRYVMVGGAISRIFQAMILGPLISLTRKKMGILMHKPNAKDQIDMMKLIEAGNVVPVIDRQYPLQDVAEAMRYFGEGQHQGKIIIQVS